MCVMRVSRYEIRRKPLLLGDCIQVEVCFFYILPNGKESISMLKQGPIDPYTKYVNKPNILERLIGISWRDKIRRAEKVLTKRADIRFKKEEQAYEEWLDDLCLLGRR